MKGIMWVETKAQRIAEVPKRWQARYATFGFDKQEIMQKLLAERPTSEDRIAEIIGNRSWTELICSVCNEDQERLVHTAAYYYDGTGPDGYHGAFCQSCLRQMLFLSCGETC